MAFFLLNRRYGTKCSGCGQGIAPSDLVRKPRDKVFHLNCFTCCICHKQLSTGEQLYVLDDNKYICKDDYLLGKTPSVCGHNSLSGKLLLFTLSPFKFKFCQSVSQLADQYTTTKKAKVKLNTMSYYHIIYK